MSISLVEELPVVKSNKDKILEVQEGKTDELEINDPTEEELETALSLSSLKSLSVRFSGTINTFR